jgi:hypothetical protein
VKRSDTRHFDTERANGSRDGHHQKYESENVIYATGGRSEPTWRPELLRSRSMTAHVEKKGRHECVTA